MATIVPRQRTSEEAVTLFGRFVPFVAVSAILLAGCSATEWMTRTTADDGLAAIAVIAEVKTARQQGQIIPGILAQVILPAEPQVADEEASIRFAIYVDRPRDLAQAKPDFEWTYSGDDVARARAHSPLGTMYTYWLPLKGKLASADRFDMLTIYSAGTERVLTQWNRLQRHRQATTTVEHFTDAVAPASPTTNQAGAMSGTDK